MEFNKMYGLLRKKAMPYLPREEDLEWEPSSEPEKGPEQEVLPEQDKVPEEKMVPDIVEPIPEIEIPAAVKQLEGGKTVIRKPVSFTGAQVRAIRIQSGMTQTVMAAYMGVNKKTVESWESGHSRILGPANRLLEQLIWQNKEDREHGIKRIYEIGK